MGSQEEETLKIFRELNQKFETFKTRQSPTFSEDAMFEFCRGFNIPLLGPLSFLQQNIGTHSLIQCIATGDKLGEHLITDENSYYDFCEQLKTITPPARVDFTFNLSGSSYLDDISETFSVYFSDINYEIGYSHEGDKEFRITKQYMSHIEPDEVRQLQSLISNSIIIKQSNSIDSLLK